jgi:hypothetical protein
MPQYEALAQMRGGATPHTYDGAVTVSLNSMARRIIGLTLSHSISVRTTDEAVGMVVRLSSSEWNGNRYFGMGFGGTMGPATNSSQQSVALDYMPFLQPVAANSDIVVDITTVLGATMTGTNDITLIIHYDSGDTPVDVLQAAAAKSGLPYNIRGGNYVYTAAQTGTAETALTGNNTEVANIPAEAKEIVGSRQLSATDGALTADEEITGYVRWDFGIPEQGDQRSPIPALVPGDGTEVDTGAVANWSHSPMYLRLPSKLVVTRGYINLYGASTGNYTGAFNLLWR